MVFRITLLALCLALALPAPAVYAQDDCEEADCGSSAEAASAAETGPDDSTGEEAAAADAGDAESVESEEESAESADAEAEPASGSDDAAIDEDLTEAETDFSELAQDEAALATDDDADESTPVEGPSDTTPVDPPSEPASPQSPTEPAPAAPASPPADAVALQAFRDQVFDCFISQAIQLPAGVDISQHPDIARYLHCYTEGERAPELRIREHVALFSRIGAYYGGNGKQTFMLPRLPDGYCICMHGKYPRRGDAALGEIDEHNPVSRELCRLEKIGNPGFNGNECR